MSVARAVLPVGAGLSSAYVYNNSSYVRDALSAALSPSAPASEAGQLRDMVSALSSQVDGLSQTQQRSTSILIQQAQPATILGFQAWKVVGLASTAGMIYFKVKGYELRDLVYVSKGHFKTVSEALKSQISNLESAVASAREEFGVKLGLLSSKVDETRESIEGKVDAKIAAVEGRLGSLSEDLSEVGAQVSSATLKIDEIATDVSAVKAKLIDFGPEWDERFLKMQMEFEAVKDETAQGNASIRRDVTRVDSKLDGLTRSTQLQLNGVASNLQHQSRGIGLLCEVICSHPDLAPVSVGSLLKDLQDFAQAEREQASTETRALRRPALRRPSSGGLLGIGKPALAKS
eukprot:c21004_g1_i1.p1 GENE.c21004_g1_i1~~c21004_g1_i1.p1  ORF type:complete len:347 (+),score=60.12 c21004_g1_i1:46-1086(+)